MSGAVGSTGSSKVKHVVAGLVGVAFVAFAVVAFRWSTKRANVAEAEREAELALVDLADGIARCATKSGKNLPVSARPVPAKLSQVTHQKYVSQPEDYSDAAYVCAGFSKVAPQGMQYVWRKVDETQGYVQAIGDFNRDGVPDRWLEVPIACRDNECRTTNYVYDVGEDGVRHPPRALAALGRADEYHAEPPSHDPDEPSSWSTSAPSEAKATEGKEVVVAQNKVLEKFRPDTDGRPLPLNAIFDAADRKIAIEHPTLSLVAFEATNLDGQKPVDPKSGAHVRLVYGEPGANDEVSVGSEVYSLTYTNKGLVGVTEKAKEKLRRLDTPLCRPEAAVEATKENIKSFAYVYDAKKNMPVYVFLGGKKPLVMSSKACALLAR
jgi:hypothetical protein